MKRHIKLFEEFGSNEPKKYFVVSHYTNGQIYGLFDNEAEAMETYNEYAEEAREEEYTKGGYDEDEYDDIEQEEVDIEEFDPNDAEQVENVYSCARNWGDKDLVKQLISIGADPMTEFGTAEELVSFFDGDFSWVTGMPEGPVKDKLLRMKKGKSAFGM